MSNLKLNKLIKSELEKINKDYKKLKLDTNFFEQGIDSLDFFKLIFNLEKKLKKKMTPKIYSKMSSISKISKYFEK